MPLNEEPQEPETPQDSELPGEGGQQRIDRLEVQFEFQQRLPGGFIRLSWRWSRSSNRPESPKSRRRGAIALVIFFTLIIIGLIAVGPEGVWREIKELLPNLFGSAVLDFAA